MKHTLEEVEKMLAELPGWPWKENKSRGTYSIDSLHGYDFVFLLPSHGQSERIIENFYKFIILSPEIISDLVNEIRIAHESVKIIQFFYNNEWKRILEENKILREALEFYANEKHIECEGKENHNISGCDDCSVEYIEDGSRARKALEGK